MKVYVFIDASNIIYGVKSDGWKMDFKKLMSYLQSRYSASRILYYAGRDDKNPGQHEFYKVIEGLGYELRLIPVKTFSDGTRKADADARLAHEATLYSKDFDMGIFFTGDGDYYWLFKYFMEIKKPIKLISHKNSTARELKTLFKGEYTDLSRLKEFLELKKQ